MRDLGIFVIYKDGVQYNENDYIAKEGPRRDAIVAEVIQPGFKTSAGYGNGVPIVIEPAVVITKPVYDDIQKTRPQKLVEEPKEVKIIEEILPVAKNQETKSEVEENKHSQALIELKSIIEKASYEGKESDINLLNELIGNIKVINETIR